MTEVPKLDVLAFAAHPDDVEIAAGGTVAGMVRAGRKVGVIDLTRGELGSRGSAELRDQEASATSLPALPWSGWRSLMEFANTISGRYRRTH